MFEKPFLCFEPTREAREFAVRADQSMARDDDRERVAPGRCSHRSGGTRTVEIGGEVTIGSGLAVRDFDEPEPNSDLKIRADHIEGHVELGSFESQVLTQLGSGDIEYFVASRRRVFGENDPPSSFFGPQNRAKPGA